MDALKYSPSVFCKERFSLLHSHQSTNMIWSGTQPVDRDPLECYVMDLLVPIGLPVSFATEASYTGE